MRTALDTNVLSALWKEEPSAARLTAPLREASLQGTVVLCGAVYAEALAHPLATERFVRGFLEDTGIIVDFLMDERIWVEAGRRYAHYAARRRQSTSDQPKRILADFVIGAHALITTDQLMTLDRLRYQRAFPELTLV